MSGADNQQETIAMGSSETVRRASVSVTDDETVRPPWRHGEDGRNDRPATVDQERVDVTDVPKVGAQSRATLGLPLAEVILQVQLANCWDLRVSATTRLCHTPSLGCWHEQ